MTIQLLGISGSLRKNSFNTALLRAAQELAPAGMSIGATDISTLPLYNEDVREKGLVRDVEEDHHDLAGLAAEPLPERPVDGLVDHVDDASCGIVVLEHLVPAVVLQESPAELLADAGDARPGNPAADR